MKDKELVPFNIDAEKSVLSACLLDKTAVEQVVEYLERDDFFRASHRIVFRAIECLVKRGKPVDYLTVAELLAKESVLDTVGGKAALVNYMDNTFSLTNYGYHMVIIKRMAMQRKLIDAANLIKAMAMSPQDDIDEVCDTALKMINDAVSAVKGGRSEPTEHPKQG